MTRPLHRCSVVSRAVLVAAVLVSSACGMKGRPLPPLIIVPGTVPLSVSRLGNQVYIEFDMPSENSDGSELVDLDRIEFYALTTHPDPDQPVSLEFDDWLELATLVATISVSVADMDLEDPPTTHEEPADDETTVDGTVDGEMSDQDSKIVILETLTAEVRQPVPLEDYLEEVETDEDLEDESGELRLGPFISPLPTFPRRTYRAVAISTRGRESMPIPAEVTLAAPTLAPGPPAVTYTESEVFLEWTAPATARLPVQAPAEDDVLTSAPIVEFGVVPSIYRVYALEEAADGEGDPPPSPPIELEPPRTLPPLASLNLEDLNVTTFVEPTVVFGVSRCYVVRTVDQVDGLEVIGPPSAPTCVVPVDTFPPSSPTGLIAVASAGAINLVWDASLEADVVGYLVLRRDAPGATLERITPVPIVEPAYRDTSVVTDGRYVYAVQVVDGADPPNLSPPSSEVTEQAR